MSQISWYEGGDQAICGGQGRRHNSLVAESDVSQLSHKTAAGLPLPLTWLLLGSHPPKATAPFVCTHSLSLRQAVFLSWICHIGVERKPRTRKPVAAWTYKETMYQTSWDPCPPPYRLPCSSLGHCFCQAVVGVPMLALAESALGSFSPPFLWLQKLQLVSYSSVGILHPLTLSRPNRWVA